MLRYSLFYIIKEFLSEIRIKYLNQGFLKLEKLLKFKGSQFW
ncbi:hypothetical protein HPMG_01540 [Helicobacter pullorum MIT 98-5489]|uniref:Uncharacterized protein n=1 Tax=Helicobacter pullorum MIT 98-5489 TaxID=537972 RepID=C5F1C8_9HELI|nr:hypothetical protein HPMG_01540 [Helicobacter pullorum MIT 98-5489]